MSKSLRAEKRASEAVVNVRAATTKSGLTPRSTLRGRTTSLKRSHPVLAIDGLPHELSELVPGMLYALMTDAQAIRLAIATQSLSGSADALAPSVLVTGHDPHALVKKAKSFAPPLERQLAQGSARILRLEADISRRLLRFGSAKLVDDLKAQNISQGSLVVIDQASKVLGLSDPATANVTSQIFQSWAEREKLAILFLIQSDKENPREYASLKSVSEHWAGLGVIRTSANRTSITFKHWFGSQGITPGGRFTMGLSASGALGVSVSPGGSASIDSDTTTISPSKDSNGLIATTQSLQGLADFGPRLRSCDDPLELMDFARRAKSGTILLHYSSRSEFERLGKLVANLRSITAKDVRILVRECGAKLRKTENFGLLQLGASFIIPKDVSADTAKILIDQLGSAALRRLHNPRAAENLSQILADSTGRHLTPYEFRLRITNLLDLSDASLPHTLVTLNTPVAGLAARIASLISPRIRDVMFSEHEGRLLLFLFGCNTEAAEVVMSRLFVLSKSATRAWQCSSEAEIIRQKLSSFDPPEGATDKPLATRSALASASARVAGSHRGSAAASRP
jgi:Cellulose biosynthesis GIL